MNIARLLFATMLLSMSQNLFSSTILWDVVQKVTSAGYEEFWVTETEAKPSFYAIFSIGVEIETSKKAILTADPFGPYLLSSGAWATAKVGENVTVASMLNCQSYFKCSTFEPGDTDVEMEESPITVPVGKSNYLKFILQDADQCFDCVDGVRTEMPDCYCGWVEYKVAKDGTITVLSSAIDIDGDSIVVGAGPTPEPSSGLLVLLGCAGLLLRRRRREEA